MYEQYTDKQIVEMLVPKLEKLCPYYDWNDYFNSEGYETWLHFVATLYKSGYIRDQLGRSFIIGEKKNKEPINTFKVGDKVKFLGLNIEDEKALTDRRFYPPVNTIGKVVELGSDYCFVQWPDGTTADNGVWACRNKYLEKVTEHWIPATKDNVKVGNKVRMIDGEAHRDNPWCFPDVGVMGVVTKLSDNNCEVQWPKGITTEPDRWWCNYERLEVLLCE